MFLGLSLRSKQQRINTDQKSNGFLLREAGALPYRVNR